MCSSQMRPNLLASPFTPTASSFSSILPSPFTPTASSFSSIHLSPFILRPSSFSFVSSTLTTTQQQQQQQRAITHSRCASSRMTDFDAERFEAERFRLDEQAREAMSLLANHADARGDVEQAGAWKWSIRKRVWDALENQNIARNPRPVHHRIPNFVAAGSAADKLASLQAFQNAKCVKVNPDTPQKQVRFLTLQAGKILLTPQPRLRTGFFSELEATKLPARTLEEACTAAGVAKYGKPLGLDAKIKVDLIVIGSVAVDPNTGARLGKGEGFAELEYGILRYMKAIDDSTLIVTSVHDKQLVDDIPVEKLLIHDVPVDVICTPTQIIFTNTTISKPQGIYWEKLSPEKLNQIRVLRELKEQIEKETGEQLQIGPSEKLPPTPQYRRARTSSTHHTGPSK